LYLIKGLFGKASDVPATARCGEATVRSKSGAAPPTVITVGVRLIDDRKRRIGAKLEHPFFAELTDELIIFYKRAKFSLTQRNLISTFAGYAIDGEGEAGRSVRRATCARLRALTLVFTKFEGRHLRIGWGQGVILATGLACLKALGDSKQSNKLRQTKWEEI
jgi:hypothetical protein